MLRLSREARTRWAPLVGQPWAAAVQARCQALTASDDDAEQHYERALRLHEPDTRPFDQARTQLVYGEWLRRGKRRRDARVQLHAALRTFQSLGARPWADRAHTELTAAGAPAPQPAAYHLYKAYPKLGIASRAELPALV